jgi:Protein kinase domain
LDQRRATGNKLEERHIIPIARELAKGLKSVHDAGIIHRDIKCSNVMISENGRVQIIDFGVAGVLMSNLEDDKRKTVIGTPHWMAPEMQKNAAEIAHGTEVDCWAYGITLYECAMGAPPNARTMPGRQLQSKIRQEPPPRLPGDRYSEELQDLVAFVLETDPKKRPTMDKICQQSFISESESRYPTSSLAELVQKFYFWEHSGGSRASLFIEGGAAKPQLTPAGKDDDEEWNFSTTANFEKKQQKEIIRLSMMDPNNNMDPSAFADMLANSPPTEADDFEPFDQPTAKSLASDASNSRSDIDNETRIARGARAMQGLFDESAEPYKYSYGPGDLPLRSGESGDSVHRKEVSVGSNSGAPQIDLGKAPKARTNRATMNWKWEDNLVGATNAVGAPVAASLLSPPRPQLKHSATEPPGGSDRPVSETIDLDAMLGDDMDFSLSRGTNQWGGSSTVASSAPSIVGGDETEEEDDGMIDLDIGDTMKPGYYAMGPNMMLHAKKESDSSLSLPPPSATSTLINSTQFPTGTTAVTNYPSVLPTLRSDVRSGGANFPWPNAVNPAALVNGAPVELMLDALDTGLNNWISALEALDRKFGELETVDGDGDEAQVSSTGRRPTGPKKSHQTSLSSFGDFSGPGEDVGEHIEEDDGMGPTLQDGDEGHDADVEGDGSTTGGRRW